MDVVTIRRSVLILFCSFIGLQGLSVGDDAAVSRQGNVVFPDADTNNEMNGFAVFESGFTLEKPTTTCTFDAFYPVSGTIDMNMGTLYLQQDFKFGEGAVLESIGSVFGSNYKMEFSSSVTALYGIGYLYSLNQVDQETPSVVRSVLSVDWSHDGGYVVATIEDGAGNEIYVYSLDTGADTLTLEDGENMQGGGYCARWHPSQYYVAAGKSASVPVDELYVYLFSGGAFSLADSIDNDGHNGQGVAWNPQGDRLAVAWDTNGSLDVYSFSAGTLGGLGHSTAFGAGEDPTQNSLVFDQTGNYIAVGIDHATTSKLEIFYYSAASPTSTASVDTGADAVTAVDWSKTGSWIAIGTDGSSGQLRVYEFDSVANSLTEVTKIDVGGTVLSTHWSSDAGMLLVGLAAQSGTELRVYQFVSQGSLATLHLEEISADVYSARWHPNDSYIVTGDSANNLTLFEPSSLATTYGATFDNLLFGIQNNLAWQITVTFQGDCSIDGNHKMITLEGNGEMVIGSGASLTIRNANLKGISGSRIKCIDDTASIVFRDCELLISDTVTFDTGSIKFEENVTLAGSYPLRYESAFGSTIASKAKLYLDEGFTFSYNPSTSSKNGLIFEDDTAEMVLRGATLYASSTGITLKTGKFYVVDTSYLSCEGDGEITLGSGTQSEDLQCVVKGVKWLNLTQGSLAYRNVGSSIWTMEDDLSELIISTDAKLKLYETLDIGDGTVHFEDGGYLYQASGKTIVGNVAADGGINYGTLE